MTLASARPRKPPLIIASSIIPRDIRWLWYPYVPSSAASLIFGPGGHGKSHITVDIAAALSRGRPLPGQTEKMKPQKVLMLSAEDEFDAVLVPRLNKAGADLTKIGFPRDPFTLDKDGLKMLEDYMHEFAAAVVFIDPVVRYIGSKVDLNKANQTREFTGGLHELAMKKQSSIIIVGHSRKGKQDDTSEDWEKAMGSADFSNAVRSVMFVTKSGDGSRVMRHVKANYSPLGPTQGFEFDDGYFKWTGEAAEVDDFEQSRRVSVKGRNKVENWLRAKLSNGRMASKDLEADAKAAGYSWRTVNRYKSSIAESFMEVIDGRPVWYWTLRSDVEPIGDNDNGFYVPSVEDGEEFPVSEKGRRGSGGDVERNSRKTIGNVSRRVGAGGREPLSERKGSGATVSPSPAEAAPRDPKAIAKAFLEGRL